MADVKHSGPIPIPFTECHIGDVVFGMLQGLHYYACWLCGTVTVDRERHALLCLAVHA